MYEYKPGRSSYSINPHIGRYGFIQVCIRHFFPFTVLYNPFQPPTHSISRPLSFTALLLFLYIVIACKLSPGQATVTVDHRQRKAWQVPNASV